MNVLSAADLLQGTEVEYRILIPSEVLKPGAKEDVGEQVVTISPISIGQFSSISKASRNQPELIPILMIKEGLVEPKMEITQIQRMHVGLVDFLVRRIKKVSGFEQSQTIVEPKEAPLGKATFLLAKHFGWTPKQIAGLTSKQINFFLAEIDKTS